MALDVFLLRSTFVLAVKRQPQVVHHFYKILFERHPQARALFGRNSVAAQEKMLSDSLVAIVDHLEDAPWLTTTLKALGAKHQGYGVTPEMYGWVGEALLAALAQAAGKDWSPAAEAAWSDAYGAIVSMMNPA